MIEFKINIDYSFIESIIETKITSNFLPKLIEHEAAKGIYNHATRFNNTTLKMADFWEKILINTKNKGTAHLKKIESCVEYMKSHETDFQSSFEELQEYIPDKFILNCNLNLIVGYDIGVVSEGNAYLNLGHPHFHEDKNELIYFAMHELHHVVFNHYHELYSFDDLKTTKNLIDVVKYSTQLEGLGVYSPYARRKTNNHINHLDYQILEDKNRKEKSIREFFEIYIRINKLKERQLIETDLDIFDLMSGENRLWYVTGAHMAAVIDKTLGRKRLLGTILRGPDDFFETFEKIRFGD
ncbi:MAG: DUF5700 domain-containing putative Zn-dependent protease [Candidatus Kariarchaeaceae archaeon]|jgi:hypothetical protein